MHVMSGDASGKVASTSILIRHGNIDLHFRAAGIQPLDYYCIAFLEEFPSQFARSGKFAFIRIEFLRETGKAPHPRMLRQEGVDSRDLLTQQGRDLRLLRQIGEG